MPKTYIGLKKKKTRDVRNSVLPVFKDSGTELIPTGTEVIVANRTDLFKNISTLSLHGKIDVGCHLLRDRTC